MNSRAVLAGELVADAQGDAVAAVALEPRDVRRRCARPTALVASVLPSSTTSVSTSSPHACAGISSSTPPIASSSSSAAMTTTTGSRRVPSWRAVKAAIAFARTSSVHGATAFVLRVLTAGIILGRPAGRSRGAHRVASRVRSERPITPVLDLQATRPAGPGPTPVADAPPRRPWRVLLLGCAVVAALSLLGPRALTYDPTAWLIWGREIIHGSLETRYGPSWKPLPMLFTTPFSLLGHDAARAAVARRRAHRRAHGARSSPSAWRAGWPGRWPACSPRPGSACPRRTCPSRSAGSPRACSRPPRSAPSSAISTAAAGRPSRSPSSRRCAVRRSGRCSRSTPCGCCARPRTCAPACASPPSRSRPARP